MGNDRTARIVGLIQINVALRLPMLRNCARFSPTDILFIIVDSYSNTNSLVEFE